MENTTATRINYENNPNYEPVEDPIKQFRKTKIYKKFEVKNPKGENLGFGETGIFGLFEDYESGMTQKDLAEKYEVSKSAIQRTLKKAFDLGLITKRSLLKNNAETRVQMALDYKTGKSIDKIRQEYLPQRSEVEVRKIVDYTLNNMDYNPMDKTKLEKIASSQGYAAKTAKKVIDMNSGETRDSLRANLELLLCGNDEDRADAKKALSVLEAASPERAAVMTLAQEGDTEALYLAKELRHKKSEYTALTKIANSNSKFQDQAREILTGKSSISARVLELPEKKIEYTPEQEQEIVLEYVRAEFRPEIAEQYGLTQTQLNQMVKEQTAKPILPGTFERLEKSWGKQLVKELQSISIMLDNFTPIYAAIRNRETYRAIEADKKGYFSKVRKYASAAAVAFSSVAAFIGFGNK